MLVFGNWKMNTDHGSAVALARDLRAAFGAPPPKVGLAVFPPLPFIGSVVAALDGSPVGVGAQNCFWEERGAFTGEVSPAQVASVGATSVIVGHSERRHVLGDDDDAVKRKLQAALGAGLLAVLCVGETLEQRDDGTAEAVVTGQVDHAFGGLTSGELDRTVIAYEPVWAIGTGRTATPEQASEMHAVVRATIARRFGEDAARNAPILYGGSVNPENAPSLLQAEGVDGALVGGASLEAGKFAAIAQAASLAAG